MASAYLTRTLGTPTLNTKYTFSVWVKRSTPSSAHTLIGGSSSAPDTFIINSNNKLTYYANDGSSASISTTRLLRDTSAFYHLVLAVDTTQATASDRVKMYINGTLQTALDTSTYPAQNYANKLNSAVPHRIGQNPTYNSETFDGLMTHIHFIDGTQYQASDFGESDSTSGIWKPKTAPSVTYGNNGFFLDMADSSAMGDDESGNTNDFTVNGTITQTEDTPSNNFATLNALQPQASLITLLNGNTSMSNNNTAWDSGHSTLGLNTGKWYWEVKINSSPTYIRIGIDEESQISNTASALGSGSNQVAYNQAGDYVKNNSETAYGASITTGDILGVALDLDNNKLYFSKNGSLQSSTGIDITAGTYFFAVGDNNASNSSTFEVNFGNPTFSITSGNTDGEYGNFEYSTTITGDSASKTFKALNTKNLAEYG